MVILQYGLEWNYDYDYDYDYVYDYTMIMQKGQMTIGDNLLI